MFRFQNEQPTTTHNNMHESTSDAKQKNPDVRKHALCVHLDPVQEPQLLHAEKPLGGSQRGKGLLGAGSFPILHLDADYTFELICEIYQAIHWSVLFSVCIFDFNVFFECSISWTITLMKWGPDLPLLFTFCIFAWCPPDNGTSRKHQDWFWSYHSQILL